ncbi:MAG: hypothetical protein AMXMBFR78_33740 [Rubrivivax sp.]
MTALRLLLIAAMPLLAAACGGSDVDEVPMDLNNAQPASAGPYCPRASGFVGPLPEACSP